MFEFTWHLFILIPEDQLYAGEDENLTDEGEFDLVAGPLVLKGCLAHNANTRSVSSLS